LVIAAARITRDRPVKVEADTPGTALDTLMVAVVAAVVAAVVVAVVAVVVVVVVVAVAVAGVLAVEVALSTDVCDEGILRWEDGAILADSDGLVDFSFVSASFNLLRSSLVTGRSLTGPGFVLED
jgi:hypothetical protein